MQYLKADTITEVTVGPAVAVGDAFTPVTSLTIAGADEAEFIKHGATTSTAIAGTLAAITNADGYYALDLSATDTNTEGRLTLLINDDSLILPIRLEFMVVNANVFDSLFAVAGTDLLQIDQTEIVGGTVPAPTTTGVPDVNVERVFDTLVTLSGGLLDINVQTMDANSIASGTIASGELTNIENEIWDALKSAHVVANSFGDFLDIEVSSRLAEASINTTGGAVDTVTTVTTVNGLSASALTAIEDEIWDALKSGHVVANSFGDFLDIEVSSRLAAADINLTGGALDVVTTVTNDVGITPTAVDDIWDEVLTGATHNVINSSGRRLRIIQEAGSYTAGNIFIDTINGTAGTTNFENGVDILASLTLADANTISTSLGLNKFMIAPASSLTFVATQANQEFSGENWTLALGGQSISGSHFQGADITGIGTGASEIHFEHCEMGTCTLSTAHLDFCDLAGTITLSAADTYFFVNCSHAGTTIIDFGAAVGNTTVHLHGYLGAIQINNMGQTGTDILHFDSPGGQLTLDSSCVGGTANIRGVTELVDNSSGMTINRGGDIVNDVANLFITQLTQSYAANGVAPTMAQAIFAIHQMLMQFGISGTSLTVRQLDDLATAFIVTLDDATNPTDAKRV